MTYDLRKLKDNRDALLLAEVAAWLHDWRKCSDEHLQLMSGGNVQGLSKNDLANRALSLTSNRIILPAPICQMSIFDLMEAGRRGSEIEPNIAECILYLRRCHHAAHVEKEKDELDTEGRQNYGQGVLLSSPFGYENVTVSQLTNQLWGIQWPLLADSSKHSQARSQLSDVFNHALGDTRRPINEVTLWDWSSVVAVLYKPALAGALLGHQPQPNDLRWRLLSVCVDSEAFAEGVARIPDLLARQDLLADAFTRVRQLLEEEYPLGTCVYQDANSSLYVVPELDKLLDEATDENNTSLRVLIHRAFAQGTVKDDARLALSGEVRASVELDQQAWQAQKPDRSSFDVPPIARILHKKVSTHADVDDVAKWWPTNVNRDICPVCGLRPQADPKSADAAELKAGERKVCRICEQRRADRAREWARQLPTTIWTDEVADVNGRVALIVGQFDLERWLDGTFVQTLTVTEPQNGTVMLKNPSFARLRRVWETTRQFWQSALDEPDAQGAPTIQPISTRLAIIPQNRGQLDLGQFHAYELVVGRAHVSAVWDSDDQRFITSDNLDYLRKPEQIGKPLDEAIRAGQRLRVEQPAGYGRSREQPIEVSVASVSKLTDAYKPVIPILAEPLTFMALVPANCALNVVHAIKSKYEREMGKVRNRLPLTLGVVYFARRTPLATALDAGRRMLKVKVNREQWTVNSAPINSASACVITLTDGEREVRMRVPTVMGDGTTPDVWYPYWRVNGKPTDRARWFVGADGEHWIHVNDLRANDTVDFMRSTFDFEFLDTTARRFEVSYDADGRRRGADKRQRPYLLEQLDELAQTWQTVRCLNASQVKTLESLVETKRRDWLQPMATAQAREAFRQLVRDALVEVKLDANALEQPTVDGLLADALELHLTIHKEETGKQEAK